MNSGGKYLSRRAHILVIILLTYFTSSYIYKYSFFISFIFEVMMEDRDNELLIFDEIKEKIDLVLGIVVSLVMFGVFVVLVVPRVGIEPSSSVPNKPRWRISRVDCECIVSPM